MVAKVFGESSVGASTDRTVKVLYIAGWGRSGSTLLGRIIGQLEDFFLVGELRYLWDRGLIDNRLCSCGMPFGECPVWRKVLYEAFGKMGNVNAEEMVRLREYGLRTRHVLLAPTNRILQARIKRMGPYLEALERLYQAVRDTSQSRVIVDTSKFPSYGYLLQNTPGIELYVLHLIRDPRAVAYSWEVRKKLALDRSDEPNSIMPPHGFADSSLAWDRWNLTIDRAWRHAHGRYKVLRYEDFVENPQSSIRGILRFLGEKVTELPFEDERTISLEVPHTFSGNPNRFGADKVTIKPDDEWKHNMGIARQAMVTTLTWPGIVHYKYPLRPQRGLTNRREI